MTWLRKVLHVAKEAKLPPMRSTQGELAEERRARKDEHDRTARLAKVLDDYRKQDEALRR